MPLAIFRPSCVFFSADGSDRVAGDRQYSPEIQRALDSVKYIAKHIKNEDDTNEVRDELITPKLWLAIYTRHYQNSALI